MTKKKTTIVIKAIDTLAEYAGRWECTCEAAGRGFREAELHATEEHATEPDFQPIEEGDPDPVLRPTAPEE